MASICEFAVPLIICHLSTLVAITHLLSICCCCCVGVVVVFVLFLFCFVFFFFFQAEDGIRDVAVTGVQTCALPICGVVVVIAVRFDKV